MRACACVCLSIVSVVSLRDQRALSNEPDRMTSHSVRSRRKSTNLPQRARARGARALPSLSLRPRRRLLNYYSHLPLPLIKLARPAAAATAAASSRVAYTLTGFFKSKLITISREQRHSHARADLGGEKQQERSKGLTGKSIFHQSIVHPARSVVGWMGDRPTDNRIKSTIAIVLLHFLSTTSPQWQSPPFTMDERASGHGRNQSSGAARPLPIPIAVWCPPVHFSSVSRSFHSSAPSSESIVRLQYNCITAEQRSAEHDNSLIHSVAPLELHDPHFFRHPPSLSSRVGARAETDCSKMIITESSCRRRRRCRVLYIKRSK